MDKIKTTGIDPSVPSVAHSLLIHIGYHKTASTWLQNSVFKPANGFLQPLTMRELYELLVSPAPLAFDCNMARQQIVARMIAANAEGLTPVLSHERFCGDPFTGARDAKEIANRLYAAFPQAKVLIVIREQFELIASLYRTYVLQGGKAPLESFLDPKNDEINQWFDYTTYRFTKLIDYYRQTFGADRVIVAAFEELKKDNQKFYETLCSELEGDKRLLASAAHERVNKSLSDSGIEALRWINLAFGVFNAYPLQESGNPLWRMFRSGVFRMEWLFSRISRKGVLKKRARKVLLGKYKEDNLRLQSYVDLNLSAAGYEM